MYSNILLVPSNLIVQCYYDDDGAYDTGCLQYVIILSPPPPVRMYMGRLWFRHLIVLIIY